MQRKRTQELLEKFFRCCEATSGKQLNGLERSKLIAALDNEQTEQILDIIETIRTFEYSEHMGEVIAKGTPEQYGYSGNTITITDSSDPRIRTLYGK